MERLLDFSKPVDVALLEQVHQSLQTSPDAQVRQQADKTLTAFKEHPDAWQQVAAILETAQGPGCRFYGLQVLEDAIRYRWKALPADQREGIRNYVVKLIIDLSTQKTPGMGAFVGKLNLILVLILKQEWPHNWPQFIPELLQSSKTSEELCENNMNILRLLSEEVFDFSKEEMTTAKVKELKQRLNTEFRQIFELCQLVLQQSTRPTLITVTLQTLLKFLAWIPLGYIFETPLVDQLLTKFLPNHAFRNDTLACLTEIASLQEEQYNPIFQRIFTGVMTLLQQQLPPSTDIAHEFDQATQRDCDFIQGLSLFFAAFFGKHLPLLEQPENHGALITAMFYFVSISMVDEPSIFAICLEGWNKFTRELYESERALANFGGGMGVGGGGNPNGGVLALGGGGAGGGGAAGGQAGAQEQFLSSHVGSPRKKLYGPVLTRVRRVMIGKMSKPEEVLIVEGDDGTIVRETIKDTASIAQYKTMRDTLVFLTHLDCDDTENIMLAKLALQCEADPKANEFTWHNLNTLCWAMGSISGAMNEESEKSFLVAVIKDLLSLCEKKRGKDNKAVVASNIMYVVGQYPRFLRAHWKFLKTVVKKLFEFMHELHPGVQDMACDTFLKISQKCRGQFVVLHPTETMPFIDELLVEIVATTRELSVGQRHTFYEAVGYMIREQQNDAVRNSLLDRLMRPANDVWKHVMQVGNTNAVALTEYETMQNLANVLKVNVRVCSAMEYAYRPQLMGLYLDMLHVYKFYSSKITEAVLAQGDDVIHHKNVKMMRVVKVEALHLVETFVRKAGNMTDIATNFVPPLIPPVLGDYAASVPRARSPEALQLFVTLVNKLKGEAATAMGGTLVEKVLSPVFQPTLDMIKTNHVDFPEHRLNFYRLLKALNQYCFEGLFAVPPETQQNVVNAVVWAFKHTERTIAEMGLEILDRMLTNVGGAPDAFAQGFYGTYYLSLLQDVLVVVTDRLHVSGFTMQCTILSHMFAVVAQGRVKVPLGAPAAAAAGAAAPPSNEAFLLEHVCAMIATAFPNVAKGVVREFVVGLFDQQKDLGAFKTHLRDFLIRLKEFSADGDVVDLLYAQEAEDAKRLQQQQQLQQRAAIPGLLTQAEKDEMADL